jgi:hypothetical protein
MGGGDDHDSFGLGEDFDDEGTICGLKAIALAQICAPLELDVNFSATFGDKGLARSAAVFGGEGESIDRHKGTVMI